MASSMRRDDSSGYDTSATVGLASRFYQCSHPPFVDGQPGTGFFAHVRAQAVLHALQHGIETRQGLIVCLGAAGLGKTTVLQAYLETADPQRLKAIVPAQPPKTLQELLTLVSQALGVVHPTDERVAVLFRLRQALLDEYREQRNVACFIDDAQELSVELLAEVVTLAHLDTGVGKLLQIVLLGRPELQPALKHPTVQNLTTRFVQCPALLPLTKKESVAYIQQCLTQSGAQVQHIFTAGAMQHIVAHGRGNPRTLNRLCRRVLEAGAQAQERPIAVATAKKAIAVGQRRAPVRLWRWGVLGGLGLVCGLGLGLAVQWYGTWDSAPSDTASSGSSPARRRASSDSLLPVGGEGQTLLPTVPSTSAPAPSRAVAPPPHLDQAALPAQATGQAPAPEEPRRLLVPHTSASPTPQAADDTCLLNMLQGKPCNPEPLPLSTAPRARGNAPKP